MDIMFSPSGAVISRGVTVDKINLWVRLQMPTIGPHPRAAIPSAAIRRWCRFSCGPVSSHFPPDPTPGGNPYDLVK